MIRISFLALLAASTAAAQTWPANLTVSPVPATTVSGETLPSSTRLAAGWMAPAFAVETYHLRVVDQITGQRQLLQTSATSVDLTNLKAGTTYTVSLQALLVGGSVMAANATAQASTSEEFWQLQGTGRGWFQCTQVISGSSVLAYPMVRRLEGGDSENLRVIQLYYKPRPGPNPFAAMSITQSRGPTSRLGSLVGLIEIQGYGLRSPASPALLVDRVAAFHPVPLARNMGGGVRVFFEAKGRDGKTRLMHLDSKDGVLGRDFHPGKATVVATTEDYDTNGPCEPTLVVGVRGNPNHPATGMLQARQSKLGWPYRNRPRWDGMPGTFFVITGQDACNQTSDGLFYAQWDGSQWNVVQDHAGCPVPLVTRAHGPVLVHREASRYKLYFEDWTNRPGRTNKPLHLIYGDGSINAPSERVDIDEWEATADAREVHFLWPDGSLLSVADESGLGDHAVLWPTDDPDYQVMYVNLNGFDNGTRPSASQGIGLALLRNP